MAEAEEPVRVEVIDGLAWILIDNPPVNAASAAVRKGLVDAIAAIEADPEAQAVVIACDGPTFVAGADIREFGRPPEPPALGDVVDAIEACAKPVVAAIHGTALGGGFEIALGCHARVMQANAVLGLPEVTIGLIPGAGGSQRLPRIIGVPAAMELASSGGRIGANEALKLGLADAATKGDVRMGAAQLATALIGQPIRRVSERPVPAFDQAEADRRMKAIAARARGAVAPIAAARAVGVAATHSFADGARMEREAFRQLVGSPQAAALRYVFFAERNVMRLPEYASVALRPLAKVGIVGGGAMGAGIAIAFADAGLPVTLIETDETAAEAARKRIAGLYGRLVRAQRMAQGEHDARIARIDAGSDFARLAECDLIVEAVVEDPAVKNAVFARLGAVARPGAILATNTSYLDVDAIAAASGRPQDVIGLHFFAPAQMMRLVEVVRAAQSAPDAVATGFAATRALGKVGVLSGAGEGFIGNRIAAAWRPVAEAMVEDGALPQDIDAALEAYGFAMGPFAVADLSGLDIAAGRRKRLAPTRDPAARYASTIADRLVEKGRLGQKTGAGWYRYADGRRSPDPEVATLIEKVSAEKGIARRPVAGELVVARVRAIIVNEAAKLLAEGIARRAMDIDMVLVHGFGFPAWRGGPLFEADRIGPPRILEDMREVHAYMGPGYEPAQALIEMAESGARFGQTNAAPAAATPAPAA